MPHDFFANAGPVDQRPQTLTYRYEASKRRLHVWGEDPDRDIKGIRDLIARGLIPADLDTILHTSSSEIVSIIRGRHLTVTTLW
jgi:hypothetical protein